MKYIKYQIDSVSAYEWVGWCKKELYKLNLLHQSGNTDRKFYELPGNVMLELIVEDDKDTIRMWEEIDGFLFHPRTGPVEYYIYNTDTTVYSIPYVNGTGWTPNGKDLPKPAVPYPLVDDDHGTRNVFKGVDKKWGYSTDPPENYGNIDWKGKNTAKENKTPNQPILTWKGPVSRYFPTATTSPAFNMGPNIYESGSVKASLPVSPYYSEIDFVQIPYFVLGAAKQTITVNKKKQDWLVVVGREFYEELDGETLIVYSAMIIAIKPWNSSDDNYYDVKKHPTGWRILHDDRKSSGGMTLSVPMFFNQSGTEARTIQSGREVVAKVDVDKKTATLSYTPVVTSGTKNFVGVPPYSVTSGDSRNGTYSFVLSGVYTVDAASGGGMVEGPATTKIAVDFIEDKAVYAEITWNLSGNGDTGTHSIYNHSVVGTHGSATGNDTSTTASIGNHAATCYIKFGTVNEKLADYKLYYFNGSYTTFNGSYIWNINDGPDPGSVATSDNIVEQDLALTLSILLFMDIRYDTLLYVKSETSSKSKIYTNVYYRINGVNVSAPDRDELVNNPITYKFYLISPIKESQTFSAFNINYLDVTSFQFTDPYPLVIINSTNYSEASVFALYFTSNEPICSFAADRQKNYFISLLYNGGVYNFLTDSEDVVKLTKTEGGNPVFFPIAPV